MEPYGRTVPDSEAHTYVENYKTLRGKLITEVLPWVPDYAPQDVKDSVTFHKSKGNAFLFDLALIRSLIDAPDAPTHFAVYLGAIGGNPTVVVGALKAGSQPNTLIASTAPSDEHAKLLYDVKYPSNDNGPITVE